jgi:DNA-directed RNA polymerase specialized sigma24 family protein
MTPPRQQPDQSFNEFVIEHGPTLLGVARRHASTRRLPNSAAEDIYSEALARAWRRWEQIERDRTFGWVCVTAYNEAYSRVAPEVERDNG